MLRTKIVLALSFVSVPAAQAAEPSPNVLVHEGDRFEYYMKLDDDIIRIDGVLAANGDKFSLTVKPSGRVTGYFGRIPVDYHVARSMRDRLAARLKREQYIALSDASGR